MKKNLEQRTVNKSSQVQKTVDDLSPEKRELKILNHINKRKVENEALKKLLENLNSSNPVIKTKKRNKNN